MFDPIAGKITKYYPTITQQQIYHLTGWVPSKAGMIPSENGTYVDYEDYMDMVRFQLKKRLDAIEIIVKLQTQIVRIQRVARKNPKSKQSKAILKIINTPVELNGKI